MVYTKSTWNGFQRLDFELNGREAILILPETSVEGKKWLLKTEYFDAFPAFEIEMVKQGYHLAYIKNETRWHKDEADDDAKAALADFLVKEFGLNEKCLPVGMSCGGMQAVYFTAKYPEKVAALYLDAPVMNLLSCPCAAGRDVGEKQATFDYMYDEMVRLTGRTLVDLINYRNHPIDNVDAIIENNIPVMLIVGGKDIIVPYGENGKLLVEKMRKAGKDLTLIIKPDCEHHPHSLEDLTPLLDFVRKHY